MTESFEFRENSINELEFPRGTDDPLVITDIIVIFEEEIGMIATLSELHHQVC